MNVLRSIGQDLVEKKLWPVAVALVALLAALPMLLGGGGDDVVVAEQPAAITAAAPVDLPGAGQIAVAAEPPPAAPRAKSRRDPFRQQFVKKAEAEVTAAAGGAAPAAGKDAGGTAPTGKSGGDAGAKAPTSPAPTTPTKPKAQAPAPELDPLDVYRVTLRFGRVGKQKTIRDIARLSPLPNADQPFFVFLGVLKGGGKAVYLVSSDATPTGEGRCLPSKSDCQTLELAPGDTTYLERESGSETIRYRLDQASIRRRSSVSSPTSGDLTPTRAKKDSGDDAATALAAGTDYRWDAKAGVLVRRESAKTRAGEDAASQAQAAAEAEAREAATIALVTWYFAIIGSIQHAAAQAVVPAPPAPEAAPPAVPAAEPAPVPAPAPAP